MKMILLTVLGCVALFAFYLSYTLWYEFGRAPKSSALQAQVKNAGHFDSGHFVNELPTPEQTGNFSYHTMLREMISPSNQRKPKQRVPSVQNTLTQLDVRKNQIVWFGHSSYLLTLDGLTVLVDPVFSGHSSPLPFVVKSFEGTDAYTVEDLPPIDVLLISHDHYDHLDYDTVKKLRTKVKQAVVPLGVGEHLRFWGYADAQITELNWHESTRVDGLTLTATPARHFSGRALVRNNTLWASFVLKSATHSIYIGGDSGYGPHFKAIGEQYGPFDLAMLESGQYSEHWRYIHMMPEETVQAARDLRSEVLFPVHWGKFVLSLHEWDEPIKRVVQAAQNTQQQLLTPKIGQVVDLANVSAAMQPWWDTQAMRNPFLGAIPQIAFDRIAK